MSAFQSAPAKVNLILRVGTRSGPGLHDLCSLFASLELADRVRLEPAPEGRDSVRCPGVPGENLAASALSAFRDAAPEAPLEPLRITIEKAIPVAAGLGGGSADAAAVLRGANEMAGGPLDHRALLALAARLGSDVPSQLLPAHAIVRGSGQLVEPVRLPVLHIVLVPDERGLSTADVYRELDRLREDGEAPPPGSLDPAPLRDLADRGISALAAGLENDLEVAALSLRPELIGCLTALRDRRALAALLTGSGPTAFGLFTDERSAEEAARELPGAIATRTR